jgi:hypothetical protein
MDAHLNEESRKTADRRQRATSLRDVLRPYGRRMVFRRSGEHRQSYFVDSFGLATLAFIVSLLALSIFDGVITLSLLDAGCQEINPLMACFLRQGSLFFLLGKYLLTAVSIMIFVVFKNFCLFGTSFRVGYLIPLVVAAYTALLAYQLYLVHHLAAA